MTSSSHSSATSLISSAIRSRGELRWEARFEFHNYPFSYHQGRARTSWCEALLLLVCSNHSHQRSRPNFSLSKYHSFTRDAFLRAENAPHLATVLDSIREGCLFFPDPNVQRMCIAIFRRLVPSFAGKNEFITKYLFEKVVGVCFELPSSKQFDLEDASTYNVPFPLSLFIWCEALLEICHFMVDLRTTSKGHLTTFLRDQYFPSINSPRDFSETYLRILESNEQKLARKLRSFVHVLYSLSSISTHL